MLRLDWFLEFAPAARWEGQTVIGNALVTLETQLSVNCTAPPSPCTAEPGSGSSLIEFTTFLADTFPEINDIEGLCDQIAALIQADAAHDQFAQDGEPPGLADDSNDIVNSVAFTLREGITWSAGQSACDGTVGSVLVRCGVNPRTDGSPAYVSWFETAADPLVSDHYSIGLNLVLDDDPSNNYAAPLDLPLSVIGGADALVAPAAMADGSFGPPVYSDLRDNTGRQTDAIFLSAPRWYGFLTFDSTTGILPWICQFDPAGQGADYQACDLPGGAVMDNGFDYVRPVFIE
jgi:hypothetical protein